MIFLYATTLKNDNEAADMYVYRVAEIKAILIGRVARALKESAIDCILNKSQQDSTEEIMKQKKRLVLSNGQKIMYTIGDKPFTQQCDYMEKCSYTCIPNANISESDITLDTYFIPTNNTLLMKVKDLFKEHYFFKKDQLVRLLQYDKPYSLEQINVVLNKLVEDKTEIIEDRYKRAGHMINIGEYYIYQPLELDNDHVSLFDRNRPIDYKRNNMVLEISELSKGELFGDGNSREIIDGFEESFTNAFSPVEKTKKSEKDWYKNAAKAIIRLEKAGMKRQLIEEFITDHIWSTSSSSDKLVVLNFMFSQDRRTFDGFLHLLNKSIDKTLLTFKSKKGIYLIEGEKPVLYVLNTSSQWIRGEKTDNDNFTPIYVENIRQLIVQLNEIYGFIIPFKETNEMIFKTKIRDQKRQSGARCDQASKKETIKTLNSILSSVKRDGECPTTLFTEDIVKDIGNVELCCYMELVLRCYNHHLVKKKVWFVGPEYAQKIIDHLKN